MNSTARGGSIAEVGGRPNVDMPPDVEAAFVCGKVEARMPECLRAIACSSECVSSTPAGILVTWYE